MSYTNMKVEIVRPKVPLWRFLWEYDESMSRYFGQPRLTRWLIKTLRAAEESGQPKYAVFHPDLAEQSIGVFDHEFLKARDEMLRYVWRELKRNFKDRRIVVYCNPYCDGSGYGNNFLVLVAE